MLFSRHSVSLSDDNDIVTELLLDNLKKSISNVERLKILVYNCHLSTDEQFLLECRKYDCHGFPPQPDKSDEN